MNISTPISTLWKAKRSVELIKHYSDSFEGRPFNNLDDYKEVKDKVLTFHCDTIQPIHKLESKDFKYIQSVVDHYPNLNVISFHCAYRSHKCFKHQGIGYIDGYSYSKKELKDNAYHNIIKIKQIVGDIKILIENNNYYPTKAYDIVTDASFISDIVYDNGIGLLFDQAHAEVTAHNLKINYNEYVNNLPLDKCYQIHLCKMGYSKSLYSDNFYLAEDQHLPLDHLEIAKLKQVLNKTSSVEYLTVEYYKNVEGLLNSINLIKDI